MLLQLRILIWQHNSFQMCCESVCRCQWAGVFMTEFNLIKWGDWVCCQRCFSIAPLNTWIKCQSQRFPGTVEVISLLSHWNNLLNGCLTICRYCITMCCEFLFLKKSERWIYFQSLLDDWFDSCHGSEKETHGVSTPGRERVFTPSEGV